MPSRCGGQPGRYRPRRGDQKAAFKITHAGQLVGTMASVHLGVPFGTVDLSLAPTAEIGDFAERYAR